MTLLVWIGDCLKLKALEIFARGGSFKSHRKNVNAGSRVKVKTLLNIYISGFFKF